MAKEHFINLVLKGRDVPIDADDGSTFNFEKPPWFDVDKFELGREYFLENRAGILMTNLAGLILLLTVPKGLAILRGSGRSQTPDLARDRYIDTILHTLTWYDVPLDNSTRLVREKILLNINFLSFLRLPFQVLGISSKGPPNAPLRFL